MKFKKKKLTPIVKERVVETVRKVEIPVNEVRCPSCTFKAGLKNETTACDKCDGTGLVEAEPLE
jgi:DnaJ-class molecular chaperone